MENNTEKKAFEYTYSAKERKEVEDIRKKYLEEEDSTEDALTKLRKLDNAVTQKATVVALVLGILGALICGSGMSLIMTDLGKGLGIWSVVLGLALGIVGIVICLISYPVYARIIKKEKAKIAPEIIRLTDELLK